MLNWKIGDVFNDVISDYRKYIFQENLEKIDLHKLEKAAAIDGQNFKFLNVEKFYLEKVYDDAVPYLEKKSKCLIFKCFRNENLLCSIMLFDKLFMVKYHNTILYIKKFSLIDVPISFSNVELKYEKKNSSEIRINKKRCHFIKSCKNLQTLDEKFNFAHSIDDAFVFIGANSEIIPHLKNFYFLEEGGYFYNTFYRYIYFSKTAKKFVLGVTTNLLLDDYEENVVSVIGTNIYLNFI